MDKHSKESILSRIDFLLIDIISLEICFLISYWLRFGWHNAYAKPEWRNIAIIMAIIDILVIIFGNFLSNVRRRGYLREFASIFLQTLVVEVFLGFYLYMVREGIVYSRFVLFMTGILHCFLDWTLRVLWKKLLLNIMSQKTVKMLLIGNGPLAMQFVKDLETDKIYHAKVVGYLSEIPNPKMQNFYGSIEKFEDTLRKNDIDYVVAALETNQGGQLGTVIHICEKYGVRFGIVPAFNNEMSSGATIDTYGMTKVLNFRHSPLDDTSNSYAKRLFDIIASLMLILLTSPLMLVIAIGTKLSSPGPIIFKQTRIGKDRKPFTMYKFRSMRITGTETTGWSRNEDDRKTKFGSFIRKFSLDELPQFFNVLMGQMSLIGPRPEIPFHVNHFMEEIPLYLVRQRVRPGITGWAQVNGYRGDTDISERIRYDIWYIENWTITLDIKILLLTVFGGMVNQEKLSTGSGDSSNVKKQDGV